jgi:hypothetical protein
MVADALQPDPVVDTIDGIALAQQSRYKVIIGEVCIETTPAREDTLPHQKQRECEQNGCLNRAEVQLPLGGRFTLGWHGFQGNCWLAKLFAFTSKSDNIETRERIYRGRGLLFLSAIHLLLKIELLQASHIITA